jgi:hypothetical protein
VGFSTLAARAIGVACLAASPARGLAADGALGDAERGAAPDNTRAPVQAPPAVAGRHTSGALFIGYRGSDGQTTGAIATLSPGWSAFVRLGAEVTPRSPDGGIRLLWGLGFEDWRDRTFFLHVHDWGPVRPEERATLRDAEASFGYKLPRACGGPFCLVPSAFGTVPFGGWPYAGARTALTVGRTWFVSAALGWTVPSVLEGSGDRPPWRFSFALGRWDGRPGGLFVTYRDELSVAQFRDRTRLHREGRGVFALGVNWAY